jgi:hypothetical protein
MMTPAIVMACPDLFPGFVPAIHVFDLGSITAWMPGTSLPSDLIREAGHDDGKSAALGITRLFSGGGYSGRALQRVFQPRHQLWIVS